MKLLDRFTHIPLTKWLQTALILTILAVSTVLLLKAFYDNDFFWHLKTGEWIWQHGALPDHDPFNFASSATVSLVNKFTLTSYWLGQLLLYLTFLIGGSPGIVALRFCIAALLFYAIFRRLHGDKIIDYSLLLLFSVLLLNFYFIERPQTFSFLAYAFLLLFVDRIKNKPLHESRGILDILLVSLTMILWANSHGGYLIGQGTLAIIICLEGVKFAHHRLGPMEPKRYRRLLCAGTIGIACSFINPNSYKLFLIMARIGTGDMSTQVLEYASLIEFYNITQSRVALYYLATMALTALLVVSRPKKVDITECVLLAILGYFAFSHVRYAAFFAVAAIPAIGSHLSCGKAAHWGRWLLPPIAIAIAMWASAGEFSLNMATVRNGDWVSNRLFPEKAATYIISNNLQGNMFNEYAWGGYLIWRLAPERKVFADGRNINQDVILHNYLIDVVQVNANGEPVWKTLLQKYAVNYIITYSHQQNGQPTALAGALMQDAEWVPVFLDRPSRSIIFVRNIPANARVIASRNFFSL
jgi:hypothetical protein